MCQSFVQELKNYPTYKQYELDAKYNGNRNIVLQSAAQIFGVSEWGGLHTLTSWIQGHCFPDSTQKGLLQLFALLLV